MRFLETSKMNAGRVFVLGTKLDGGRLQSCDHGGMVSRSIQVCMKILTEGTGNIGFDEGNGMMGAVREA
jgi:hypothetical protein